MPGLRPPDGLLQEGRDDQAILSRENGSGVSQITEGGFKRIKIHQAIVSGSFMGVFRLEVFKDFNSILTNMKHRF